MTGNYEGYLLEIGERAFYNCKELGGIFINKNLSQDTNIIIGNKAFYGCCNLKYIYSENERVTLGESAFEGCTDLANACFGIWSTNIDGTEVSINKGKLARIENNTFKNCKNLDNLIIDSDCIEYIGESAFAGCAKLSDFKAGKVTRIGAHAFENAGKGNFEFDGTVTEVEDYAFNGSKIDSIKLPQTIETIGNYAFKDTNISEIDKLENLKTIGDWAFHSTLLKNIEFGNKLETIGKQAFGYTCLETVIIPESVKEVKAGAFYDIQSDPYLKRVIFLNKDTKIYLAVGFYDWQSWATFGTANPEIYYIPGASFIDRNTYDYSAWEARSEGMGEDSASRMMSIDDYIWAMPRLNEEMEANAKKIDGKAMIKDENYIYSIKEATEDTEVVSIMKYIGNDTEITLPTEINGKVVTSVDANAFANNTNLTKVTVPENISYIGEAAFGGCSNIQKIVIENDNIALEENTFENCNNLELFCGLNSTAHMYAKEKEMLYQLYYNEFLLTDSENGTLVIITGIQENSKYSSANEDGLLEIPAMINNAAVLGITSTALTSSENIKYAVIRSDACYILDDGGFGNNNVTVYCRKDIPATEYQSNDKITIKTLNDIEQIPLEEIQVEEENIVIKIDETYHLNVTAVPVVQDESIIYCDSTNEDVVSMISDTSIMGISEGEADVKVVESNGREELEKIIHVKVVKETYATDLKLDKDEIHIQIDNTENNTSVLQSLATSSFKKNNRYGEGTGSYELKATIYPETVSDENIIWTSTNEEVAIVDENGKVTGLKEGIATIEAKTYDGIITQSCKVVVGNPSNAVSSISLNKSSLDLNTNDTAILTASSEDVIWETSNDSVVSVNEKVELNDEGEVISTEKGKANIQAISEGIATITAYSKEDLSVKATCKVKVGNAEEYKNINLEDNYDVVIGEGEDKIDYVFLKFDSNLDANMFTISDSDRNVALYQGIEEDDEGNQYLVLGGLSAGQTTLTITSTQDPTIKKECNIVVKETAQSEEELKPIIKGVTYDCNLLNRTIMLQVDAEAVTPSKKDSIAMGVNSITGYRFSMDEGKTWTDWQTGNVKTFGGLELNKTYRFIVQVKDEAERTQISEPKVVDFTDTRPDTKAPTIKSVKTEAPNDSNTFVVEVEAVDEETIDMSASGIAGYSFSDDGGKTYSEYQESPKWVREHTTEKTTYDVKIRVKDKKGNVAESKVYTVKTPEYNWIQSKGDIDNNKDINAKDKLLVARHIAAKLDSVIKQRHSDWELTGDSLKAADVDENGKVNAIDKLKIARYIAVKNDKNLENRHPNWKNFKNDD